MSGFSAIIRVSTQASQFSDREVSSLFILVEAFDQCEQIGSGGRIRQGIRKIDLENTMSLTLLQPVANYLSAVETKDVDMLSRCFADDALEKQREALLSDLIGQKGIKTS
jgi:hypothetical protein